MNIINHPTNAFPFLSFVAKLATNANVRFVAVDKTDCVLPTLQLEDGYILRGDETIARHLVFLTAGKVKDTPLLEVAAFGTGDEVAKRLFNEQLQWIEMAELFEAQMTTVADAALAMINSHLTLRNYMVGASFSLADAAVFHLITKHFTKSVELEEAKMQHPNLIRWYKFVSRSSVLTRAVQMESRTTKGKETAKKADSSKKFDIELPNAKQGAVVTRFPPEASGYLHIGHAKAAILNSYYAKQYGGQLIVRFDDTNPSKEKVEFEESIMNDLKTLGIKHDRLTHTSDHFEFILEMADKMIKTGRAYCDKTEKLELRDQRMRGEESKYRANSIEENMRIWQEMKSGSEEGKISVMRAKIDMRAKNKALRDPVLYRCVGEPHALTGDKYKVYPTYDFACPIVDSREGVTHALRTTEYHDRNAQYDWIIDALGMRRPIVVDFSRLNLVYTLMSKRLLRYFVNENKVDGWNDPRLPTVQGIARRGLQMDALERYIVGQGPSKNTVLQEWDQLWSENKKSIDPISPRYDAIEISGRAELELMDFEEGSNTVTNIDVPLHPKNKALGSKKVRISKILFIEGADASELAEGEEITLIGMGNAIIKSKEGNTIKAVRNPGGNVKTTKKKVNWVAKTDDSVDVLLVEFDHLITKAKIEDSDDVKDFINEVTRIDTKATGEAAIKNVKEGDIIQIIRRGYFRVDSAASPMVLFNIPTGKTKAQSSLGSKITVKTSK